MRFLQISKSAFYILLLTAIQIGCISAQKTEKKINYGIGFNFSPLGYYLESNYIINKDFDANLRYESNNYCFLCGLGENTGVGRADTWGIRQLAFSGVFKKSILNFETSLGCQYIIGLPWYADNYHKERLSGSIHRYGIFAGLSYRRINIQFAWRIPKVLHHDVWQIAAGFLIGKHRNYQ